MSVNGDWVQIFDTTLRDGEQSPGCTMNVEEKVVIAEQLEALGVDVIEAGFAAASPGDFEAVRRIAEAVKTPVVLSLSRTREADIDRALEAVSKAANPGIHIFIATSELHMEQKLGMSPDEVVDAAVWAVTRAKQHVDHVEFSAEDASRSTSEFLYRVFGEAIGAGATVCNVPDTTGYAVPEQVRELFAGLRENTRGGKDVVWSAHNHNDLGLAVANSLAAVEGGARQVECTINGIGERAGNTSMEEVVMALKTRQHFYGIDTKIVTEQIYPSSKLLSRIVGVPVAPTKPIVGDNAFAHEAGIHQDGVLKNKATYEIMRPEDVGRASNVLVLGKHSGRHALASRLRELGIDLERIDFSAAFQRFKELADKKKDIFDEDLYAIAAEDSDMSARYELLDVRVESSLQGAPRAEVTMSVDGEKKTEVAEGDGVVDACYRAIKQIAGINPRLERYQVKGITGGTDALGEVSCLIREGEVRVRGHGSHTDIIMASAIAFVDALNRYVYRVEARPGDEHVVGP
jgi:2-isopropylmalate synthase